MKSDIQQLSRRARGGDARAFSDIYEMFADEMYRYALYRLGSTAAAQDAVQETALQAWKSFSSLKNDAAAKAWFFGILSHCCKHALREKYKAGFTALEDAAQLSSTDSSDNVQLGLDLLGLLSELSEQERDIVLLSAVTGLNSKEIAKITALPAATVRSKLSRALAKLRKAIEEGGAI